MIDHLGLTTSDYNRSRDFYDATLAPLGMAAISEVASELTGGTPVVGYGRGQPVFWISGNGPPTGPAHVAFAADSRAQVDAFHRAALAAGGRDNGSPGLRPHYHPNYYAAFVLDPDGANVEAVCHAPG